MTVEYLIVKNHELVKNVIFMGLVRGRVYYTRPIYTETQLQDYLLSFSGEDDE